MKSDSHLQRDILDELAWEPSIRAAEIGVGVKDGVVTLSGFVASYPEKSRAEAAVKRVAGVKAIAEEIEVRLPSDPKSSDSEIAKRILDVFAWDVSIPADHITVKVEHGWVTLGGTVEWFYQKEAARRAAGRISGVLGVSNLITLRQVPTARDVRERIVAAFKRSADLDAAAVSVRTDGGEVTLGGKVSAWSERQIAERAAWAAPGVTSIVDNILVG